MREENEPGRGEKGRGSGKTAAARNGIRKMG